MGRIFIRGGFRFGEGRWGRIILRLGSAGLSAGVLFNAGFFMSRWLGGIFVIRVAVAFLNSFFRAFGWWVCLSVSSLISRFPFRI